MTVYCGASPGAKPEYTEAAIKTAQALVRRGIGLVYGGGRIGLMGILANAVMEMKGEVIGIIPKSLADREIAHTGLTELRIVGSMHERKAMMAELGDAFIALPGGYGTLEEISEIMTWAQIGLINKPYGVLNECGFFDPFLNFIDHAVREQFVHVSHRDALLVEDNADALVEGLELRSCEPALLAAKW
jgi:uncharacterized protein (TIGR00730 family)